MVYSRSSSNRADLYKNRWKASSKMSELRLVAIGKTGVGKSSFGNTVLNKKGVFRSSSQGSSVTKHCQLGQGMVDGHNVSIVDTPGFYDTQAEGQDGVMEEIKRCIFLSAPGPHAICFVVQIGRFTQEDVDTMESFVRHFGDALYKYAIVVFTRYDDFKRDCEENGDDCNIYNYISTLPTPIKKFVMEKCESRVVGFDNTLKGKIAQKQAHDLFSIINKMAEKNENEYYSNEELIRAEQIIVLETNAEKKRLEKQMEIQMENFRRKLEMEADEKIRLEIKKERMTLKASMEKQMETNNLRNLIKLGICAVGVGILGKVLSGVAIFGVGVSALISLYKQDKMKKLN